MTFNVRNYYTPTKASGQYEDLGIKPSFGSVYIADLNTNCQSQRHPSPTSPTSLSCLSAVHVTHWPQVPTQNL